ncbi:Tetratricopeptide repeat protein [Nostoc sp. DSM 114160]
MLKRLFQWLKKLFQSLFGGKQTASKSRGNVQKEPAPPLSDTDLEFLFNELLQGVHQARGEAWAQKWLHNIEHRITTQDWVEWLGRFGDRLLASPTPNNEMAARLVQLGELKVGEIGDVAYNIGMQLLTRNEGEPVWEYEGPDAFSTPLPSEGTVSVSESADAPENLPEGEYQTVTLEQLFVMLQEDENLRQQIAQQLAVETDDPQVLVQALISQLYPAGQSTTEQTEN